jgi:hypothetical protein
LLVDGLLVIPKGTLNEFVRPKSKSPGQDEGPRLSVREPQWYQREATEMWLPKDKEAVAETRGPAASGVLGRGYRRTVGGTGCAGVQ